MTTEEIYQLKENLKLLAQEIDPRTGYKVEDTILKSKANKMIINDAIALLEQFLRMDFSPTRIDRRKKLAFYLSEDQKRSILLSDVPITVSAFVYTINKVINDNMRKIRASQITEWLEGNGFLTEIMYKDGKGYRNITDKSALIGLCSETRTTASGREYQVVTYSKATQKFIIEHINEITDLRIPFQS